MNIESTRIYTWRGDTELLDIVKRLGLSGTRIRNIQASDLNRTLKIEMELGEKDEYENM